MRRSPILLGLLAALLACAPSWADDEVLGVSVEWREGTTAAWPETAQAICDAARASPDPRLIRGAQVVVVASEQALFEACLQSGVTGCWHPDWDDEGGAGRIYIGPPGDGGAISDATLRHELGHLARARWHDDSDADHTDAAWWLRYDTTPECR